MRALLIVILIGLVSFSLSASTARAQILNGGFDTDLSSWFTTPLAPWFEAIWDPTGNPGGSALLKHDYSFFSVDNDFVHIGQQFFCTEEDEAALCQISFEYRYDTTTNTTPLPFSAKIDGTPVFSTTLLGNTPTWNYVTVPVPCGLNQLVIEAGSRGTYNGADWRVWVDNVTATCELVVPTERRTWSSLKAHFE